jgi:RIO-like serine/threonine protein kinase
MMNHYTILPSTLQLLKPLSNKKYIYTLYEDTTKFIKIIPKTNDNKSRILNEIRFQKKAYSLGIKCPLILDYFCYNNSMYIVMDRIKGNNLASIYGTNPKQTPRWAWNKIHEIIETLYLNDIEYSDITSYNFIKTTDNEIYIVDFEHACLLDDEYLDWFVNEFLNGINEWNPDQE